MHGGEKFHKEEYIMRKIKSGTRGIAGVITKYHDAILRKTYYSPFPLDPR